MFAKFLKFVNTQLITPEEDLELIELNTRKGKDTFYDPDDFRDAYFNYIIAKRRANDNLTEPDNNCQVMRAFNTLYLDGDWYFTDAINASSYSSNASTIADIYQNIWYQEIENTLHCQEYYHFLFLPYEFPDGKGGFHSFIICNKLISVEVRMALYTNIKNRILLKEIETIAPLIGISVEEARNNYDKIFDISPLKSATLLLPFAQKSNTSRQYQLYDTSFDCDIPPEYFIFPSTPRFINEEHADIADVQSDTSSIFTENTNIDEFIALINKKTSQKFSNLGFVGRIVARFMKSLIYLSPRHIFWKKMASNEERLRCIITPLIQFIYFNYFIEHNGNVPDNRNDEFVHSLTRIMLPLLKMTTRGTNEKTQRDTYSSCYSHIKAYYDKYSGVKQMFTAEMISFWKAYCTLTPKQKKNLEYEDLRKLKTIQRRFQKLLLNWITFIKKIILAGITDEIKPFRELREDETSDPREGVTFGDVAPKQASVDTNATIEESFYTKTIRLWCLMFMFVEFYNNKTLIEPIRSILTAFSRYFIWYDKNSSGNMKLYIYNIQQTNSLGKYPFNQWLLDTNDGESLKTWIKAMYIQFIKPGLETIDKIYNLEHLLSNIQNANLIDGNLCTKMIRPFGDFDMEITRVYRNVLSTFTQEHWNPPVELDPVFSPFFPMRNGILEFLPSGDVKMHYDNHSRFMTTYTNIIWEDNYNYKCEEYKSVKQMWEQIFPIKEEREYTMKILSSTLVGSILKDMLVIMYGTGGDGKTISNNAMLGMLGSDGLMSHISIEENGKSEYVENPCGLATTMKTETILVSTSKASHDSGGITQLKNKRFCTVQEPDPNLSGGKFNCSRIKEILSGSAMTAREIYAKAEAFTANTIITLQTNILLAYSEDTDAIRRRITVIPFRSKFSTSINADKVNTLRYKFQANPALSTNLVNNPKYWQALFYILLPYAKELVKNSVKALSDIERPLSIVKATNASFAQSNGLVGWLNQNIVECEGHWLSVSDLAEDIITANNQDKERGTILVSNKKRDKYIEIYGQLMGTYMGRIYKVKPEFYDARKTKLLPTFKIETRRDETNDSLIDRYFERHAVNNLEYSDLAAKEDMFIVGYNMKSKVEESTEERELSLMSSLD